MMFHNSNRKRESVQGKDIVEDNLAQGILIGKSLILVRKKKPSDHVLNPSNWTKGQDNDA